VSCDNNITTPIIIIIADFIFIDFIFLLLLIVLPLLSSYLIVPLFFPLCPL